MADHSEHNGPYPFTYHIRVMTGLVCVLLVSIAVVRFWPVHPYAPPVYSSAGEDEIAIQAPIRTVQQSQPPPPSAPLVPIPVPNDEPVPEQEIEFPQERYSDSFDSLSVTAGEGGDGDDEITGNPEVPPRTVRIEEPTFQNRSPEKADLYVQFLVNKDGSVGEATIERIMLYDGNGGSPREVDTIDAAVIQKTISAALNWKFRPARANGQPVRAYKTGIFTVDY